MAGLIVLPLLLAWALLPASAKPGAGAAAAARSWPSGRPAPDLLGKVPDPPRTGNTRRPGRPSTTTATTTTTRAATTTKPSIPKTTQPPAPAFPQGIWTSGSQTGLTDAELAKIQSLGYDFVQANPDLTVLNRVSAAGLKASIWLGNWRDDNDTAPNCVWNTPDAALIDQINLVKDHPATFAYMIADEPHVGGCPNAPKAVLDRHNLIRSLDPNRAHKTVITENRYQDYAALANTTDVLGIVAYPCSFDDGCQPDTIQTHIRYAHAAGVQEYWSMPQIDQDVDADPYYRMVTPAELAQIYAWWRQYADPATYTGSFTFLWDGCTGCDGLASHRELHATALAESTNF